MARVEIVEGDITRLAVDAIVNAANQGLTGGGGVDGAIHRAAGPELLEASRQLAPCPTGDAVITPGFHLPARFVIHAVGPIWRGGHSGEDEQLASCYRRAFTLAREHGLASIAFPAISTGAYGFPFDRAAKLVMIEVKHELERSDQLRRIVLVPFREQEARVYRELASQVLNEGDLAPAPAGS